MAAIRVDEADGDGLQTGNSEPGKARGSDAPETIEQWLRDPEATGVRALWG